jgi:hypothetical protein
MKKRLEILCVCWFMSGIVSAEVTAILAGKLIGSETSRSAVGNVWATAYRPSPYDDEPPFATAGWYHASYRVKAIDSLWQKPQVPLVP